MKLRAFIFGVCLAASSACSGFQPLTPARSLSPASRSGAEHGDLLYVSDLGRNAVLYYTYPQGKLVGTLTGFAAASTLCADRAGDVFIVDLTGPVYVYAHGGAAPIRKLTGSGEPDGCAIDPTTGNLAVTNESSYLYGTITIYPKAKGGPKTYFNSQVDATFFCGYDDRGNLFIDGWNRSGVVILLELPRGSSQFKIMTLGHTIKTPGGVLWDGKYIAISDEGAGQIVRVTPIGKVVATVRLHEGTTVNQFWLDHGTLIGPNAQNNGTVPFWHYPDGGTPYHTIGGLTYPIGAAVSL